MDLSPLVFFSRAYQTLPHLFASIFPSNPPSPRTDRSGRPPPVAPDVGNRDLTGLRRRLDTPA